MFDSVTLSAIADELNAKILHGRIQDIVQLDALTFGFEIYATHVASVRRPEIFISPSTETGERLRKRRYLYVTTRPDDARVHLVAQKLRGSGETPSPLLLLLRKHAESALIDSITQLPHERVLKIQLDSSTEGISTLVIETIGKYANIILLDADDMVIDAVKRVTPAMSRLRVTLPHHKYVPPPPQNKLSTVTETDLARILAENPGEPLWRVLVKSIAGVSPLLAREIEYRVLSGAPTQSKDTAQIIVALQELTHAPWSPCVAYEDYDTSAQGTFESNPDRSTPRTTASEPAAFAPYFITHLRNHQNFASISAAIEKFYGDTESYAAVKEPLRAQLIDARDKLARKCDALAHQQARAGDVERLRVSGEMVLAYASQIKRQQEKLKAETETGTLEIALDPKLSAVENAQKFFKEYHHAKDAAERVPALLAAAKVEVDYAEQMLNDLDLAENRAEIDAVIVTAREAGLIVEAKQKTKVKPSAPHEFTSRDGFTILVGKNARQNEELTFRRAKTDDMWLHARNVAGAHVVIVCAGREIPASTIEEAAKFAAHYSQARNDSAVDVIVTPRRNVRRVRGGRTGMVNVTNSSTVRVIQ